MESGAEEGERLVAEAERLEREVAEEGGAASAAEETAAALRSQAEALRRDLPAALQRLRDAHARTQRVFAGIDEVGVVVGDGGGGAQTVH